MILMMINSHDLFFVFLIVEEHESLNPIDLTFMSHDVSHDADNSRDVSITDILWFWSQNKCSNHRSRYNKHLFSADKINF